MKTISQGHTTGKARRAGIPLPMFHAPRPGDEVDLFSDRREDAAEYESIVHEFESLHGAEIRTDGDC